MLGNVNTFLWRTLYLQGIRRHYIATAIEIALVSLLFLNLPYQRKLAEPLSKDSEEVDVSSAFIPSPVTDIVYAPKNDYTDELMRAVGDEITSRWLMKLLKGKWRRVLICSECMRPSPSAPRQTQDTIAEAEALPVSKLWN
ncbi:hypothetical protein HPB49_023490 [Dermacentor silvarum]|uniref:Uncharacterized protein n=1 Tax=Dermacentor silvarum TaxID=543639 RepID=A0ACB8DKK3_DERSI|nr:hypothetical protein HPB49_023490 [Dermacentor silvarum]